MLIETLSAKPRHRMVLTHVLDILNDLVTPTNEGGRMVAEEYNTDCILQDKEVPVTWDFFFWHLCAFASSRINPIFQLKINTR